MDHAYQTLAELSLANKRKLVQLLSRFDVPLIEDDIFGDLHRPEIDRPKVAKSFDNDGSGRTLWELYSHQLRTRLFSSIG